MTLAATHPPARAIGMPWRAVLACYAPAVTGIVVVLALWWLAGALFEGYPRFAAFRGFAIGPTFRAFGQLVVSGDAWRATANC